jgi:hypothetical protein
MTAPKGVKVVKRIVIIVLFICSIYSTTFAAQTSTRQSGATSQDQSVKMSRDKSKRVEKSKQLSKTETQKKALQIFKKYSSSVAQELQKIKSQSLKKSSSLTTTIYLSNIQLKIADYVRKAAQDLLNKSIIARKIILDSYPSNTLGQKMAQHFGVDIMQRTINNYVVYSDFPRVYGTNDNDILTAYKQIKINGLRKYVSDLQSQLAQTAGINSRYSFLKGEMKRTLLEMSKISGKKLATLSRESKILHEFQYLQPILQDLNTQYFLYIPDFVDNIRLLNDIKIFPLSADSRKAKQRLTIKDDGQNGYIEIINILYDFLWERLACKFDRTSNTYTITLEIFPTSYSVKNYLKYTPKQREKIISKIKNILKTYRSVDFLHEFQKMYSDAITTDYIPHFQITLIDTNQDVIVRVNDYIRDFLQSHLFTIDKFDNKYVKYIKSILAMSDITNYTSFVFDDVKETFFSQIPISNNLTITNNLLDQPAHLINSRVVQIQKVASAEIAKTIQSSLKKTKNKELSKDYTKAIELANSKNDMLTKAAVQTLALAFASNKISKQDFTLELQNLLSALKP